MILPGISLVRKKWTKCLSTTGSPEDALDGYRRSGSYSFHSLSIGPSSINSRSDAMSHISYIFEVSETTTKEPYPPSRDELLVHSFFIDYALECNSAYCSHATVEWT